MLSKKRKHVEQEDITSWFPQVLANLIMDYAHQTMCDLMACTFPTRFKMIQPADIGAPYGDWSATWIVFASPKMNKCEKDSDYAADHSYDCFGGFVCNVTNKCSHSDFKSQFEHQRDEDGVMDNLNLNLVDCKLLAVYSAEESSQYMFVHVPTSLLYLIGDNYSRSSSTPIKDIGPVDQAPNQLLYTLLSERTLEIKIF